MATLSAQFSSRKRRQYVFSLQRNGSSASASWSVRNAVSNERGVIEYCLYSRARHPVKTHPQAQIRAQPKILSLLLSLPRPVSPCIYRQRSAVIVSRNAFSLRVAMSRSEHMLYKERVCLRKQHVPSYCGSRQKIIWTTRTSPISRPRRKPNEKKAWLHPHFHTRRTGGIPSLMPLCYDVPMRCQFASYGGTAFTC